MATSNPGVLEGVQELPRNPSRDNYAYGCTELDDRVQDRDHLRRCECSNHHGVCQDCGYKITVGPSGTEYGHARARNRVDTVADGARDCPNRPTCCNTAKAGPRSDSDDAPADDGGASA